MEYVHESEVECMVYYTKRPQEGLHIYPGIINKDVYVFLRYEYQHATHVHDAIGETTDSFVREFM